MAKSTKFSDNSDAQFNILVDADVLSELILNRSGFVEDAESLLIDLNSHPYINLYVTDRGLSRIQLDDSDAFIKLQELFDGKIITVDKTITEKARCLNFADFESAIEHTCAIEMNLDAIITLNPSNFPNSSVLIWTVTNLTERVCLETCLQAEQHLLSYNTLLKPAFDGESPTKADPITPVLIPTNPSHTVSSSESLIHASTTSQAKKEQSSTVSALVISSMAVPAIAIPPAAVFTTMILAGVGLLYLKDRSYLKASRIFSL